MQSETSKRRPILAPYCTGVGLDIGYGGDPIVPTAITLDLPRPYTCVGAAPQHIAGDGTALPWFADQSLDYVYSSHLIEDFSYADQRRIVAEWLRVLKPGGHLVILAPDQQAYEADCRARGIGSNAHHIEPDMSLATFVRQVLYRQPFFLEVVHQSPLVATYSFELAAIRLPSDI